MSRLSPICISDSDDYEEEGEVKIETRLFVLSDDEESPQKNNRPQVDFDMSMHLNNHVKQDPVATKTPTSSPKTAINLDTKRLKWLSCQIKLNKERLGLKKESCDENKTSNSDDSSDSDLKTPTFDTEPTDKKKRSVEIEPKQMGEPLPDTCVDPTSKQRPSSIKGTVPKSTSVTNQSPTCSHLQYKRTETVEGGTPKKKTISKRHINSPRKVGAFGSPQKPLTQTTLTKDSFSPKKPMTSCDKRIDDNSSHNPPLYANKANSYGRLQCSKEILPFSHSQLSYLEGIEEEGEVCASRYIDALLGFVTPYCTPSPDLCFHLLSEILLKSHDSKVSVKAFAALKRIQTIHPNVPEQMNKRISMDFLDDIISKLLAGLDGTKCMSLTLKSQNALKTLTFIVDVMEQEAKRKMTPHKTIAFRLLSLEQNSGNVRKVLSWINTSVKLCSSNTNVPDFYTILNLFQRLLQLCVSISESPDKCAVILAGELIENFSQLPTLDCRTIFLQTVCSHLLKSKFLELYISSFCENAEPGEHDLSFKGMQKIIESDFLRLPQKRDDVSNCKARICASIHRSAEECEEHVMLIASSLQSYLFCHHKKLKSTPKKLAMNRDNLEQVNKIKDERQLSLIDTDAIVNMLDKADEFKGRMLSLNPALTNRTLKLLELLSNIRVWDPW